MQKWEYATVPLLVHATKQILDNWGEDGWELVAVVPGPEPGAARRLPEAARRQVPTMSGRRTPGWPSSGLTLPDGGAAGGRATCRPCRPATTSTSPASCRWPTGKLLATGKVGAEVTAEQAKELAAPVRAQRARPRSTRWSAWSKVVKVVKVVGFVASAAGLHRPARRDQRRLASCSARSSARPAGTPAARSAWPSCRWAPRSRSR